MKQYPLFFRFSFSLSVFLFLCLFNTNSLHAFYVSYDYYVHATSSSSDTISSDNVLNDQSYISEEHTMTGDDTAGNYATVKFLADLASGQIKSYAYSTGSRINDYWPYHFTATGRVNKISFQDTLHFYVPAGIYNNGITINMSGLVQGSLNSTLHAGAYGGYNVRFGSDSTNVPARDNEIGIDESGTILINDTFFLQQTLVSNGETLSSDQTFDVIVDASFDNHLTWTVAPGGVGEFSASTENDFFNTLQIQSIDVPAGVTWDSDSTVFLSQPVPVPGTIWLLGAGVLGFIGFRKRNK